ncbi:MAG TPA: heme exporter protein CcmB, partial [Desulfohalobiaceae bacterium]|nr:heme exporter protein CcmB [Desulfohalobiaceae bacterium]
LASGSSGSLDTQWMAAIFWLASCFSLVFVFNSLFGIEEEGQARLGLIISPVSLHSLWLGKVMAGFFFLLLLQTVFFLAMIVFLGTGEVLSWTVFVVSVLVIDWGMVVVASLLGSLGQGQTGRESLLSVIIFPLLIPLLLAGIRLGEGVLTQAGTVTFSSWLGLAGSFSCVYTGAALILFPHVFAE